MRWTGLVLTAAAVWLAGAGRVGADVSATLIGADLEPRRISLQSLDGRTLSYFDALRRYQTQPLDQVVRLADIEPADPPQPAAPAPADAALATAPATRQADRGVIELVDGQRLPGVWKGAAADGQSFYWQHPYMGRAVIGLDRLRSLRFDTAPDQDIPAPAGRGDRVILANGDRLEGFVVSLGPDGVEIKPGDAAVVTLPLERVRALHLASAAAATAPSGHLVCLRDGTRLRAANLAMGQDELTFQPLLGTAAVAAGTTQPAPTLAPATLPLAQVTRIDVQSSVGRLVDLADLPRAVVAGGKVFGLSMPPRVTEQALHLHAPVSVRFDLPAGATRLAALAELDLDSVDAQARAWADFEILAALDGRDVGRWTINAQHPSAWINIALDGQALTLTLEAGVNGPVLDRLRLRQAMVLVKSAAP